MTIAIIIGVILLGLWFIFFDTPKYLALYVWQRLGKNSYFAAQKSERKKLNRQTAKISVKWIERLDGDFSFKDRWQYDESTIKSIVEMERLEVTSKGYEEEYSKKWQEKEYLPIDCKKHNVGKTRFPYTLQINNDETLRHILAEQIDASSVECQSSGRLLSYDECGELGCSVLNLYIVDNECYPLIAFLKYQNPSNFLYSISNGYERRTHFFIENSPPFTSVYPCEAGGIVIDKTCWDGGWLKAEFNFSFKTHYSKHIALSGKIFTPIKFKEIKGEPLMEFDEKQYLYDLDLRRKYK